MRRAFGAPMHHVRWFLYQSSGVRLAPQQRSGRHLTDAKREEIPAAPPPENLPGSVRFLATVAGPSEVGVVPMATPSR